MSAERQRRYRERLRMAQSLEQDELSLLRARVRALEAQLAAAQAEILAAKAEIARLSPRTLLDRLKEKIKG